MRFIDCKPCRSLTAFSAPPARNLSLLQINRDQLIGILEVLIELASVAIENRKLGHG